MAVGHAILVIAFHLLKRSENYHELGVNYFDQKNADSLRRSLVRRLERLGHSVTLTLATQPA
jgi:transposase